MILDCMILPFPPATLRDTKRLAGLLLTFSRRRSLSYRNQSTDLQGKSIDWFLYNRNLRHKRVRRKKWKSTLSTGRQDKRHFQADKYRFKIKKIKKILLNVAVKTPDWRRLTDYHCNLIIWWTGNALIDFFIVTFQLLLCLFY